MSTPGTAVAIQLPYGFHMLVSAEDATRVRRFTWSMVQGYATARIPRRGGGLRTVLAHRWILGARGGFVCHRNHNRLDNRRSNLLWTKSRTRNAIDLGPRGKYKGVSRHKPAGRWVAQITLHGRNHYLGLHDTPEAAARAYDKAARRLFGRGAYLNFP